MSEGMSDWAARRDLYQPYHEGVIEGNPYRSLEVILQLVGSAPDDAHLCAIGVILLDPLLDLYWRTITERFEREMVQNEKLRKAFSCTMLDIPDEIDSRLHDLVAPAEDIGRKPR
jgi:hypothetical protein